MMKTVNTKGTANKVMTNHFEAHCYSITNCSVPVQIKAMEKLACLIAENYAEINDFIKELKKAMSMPQLNGRRVFSYVLNGNNSKRNLVKEIGNKLHEYGVLNEYNQGNEIISGTVTPLPRAMQFVNDFWTEIFSYSVLRETVKEYAEKNKLQYHILSKVALSKDEETTRVDYCFTIGDKVYMADVKCGSKFDDYYGLHKKGKELGIVPDHYIVLNTTLFDTERADGLEYFNQIYISNTKTFKSKLTKMISE